MVAIKSLIGGIVVGGLFAALKFPVPAPPTLAGVGGVVGISLGFVAISKIMG